MTGNSVEKNVLLCECDSKFSIEFKTCYILLSRCTPLPKHHVLLKNFAYPLKPCIQSKRLQRVDLNKPVKAK